MNISPTSSTKRRLASATIASLATLSVFAAPLTHTPLATAADAPAAGTTADDWYEVVHKRSGAKIWYQKNVTSEGTMKIKGEGWKDNFGGGSSIAIKLHWKSKDGTKYGTYEREKDIVTHPENGNPDVTIWKYFHAKKDGTFEVEFKLPKLEKGSKLNVNAASSLGNPGDVKRTVTSPNIIIDGEPWPGKEEPIIHCNTDLKVPKITVDEKAVKGKDGKYTVRVRGEGYCNDISGGSVVALKIDQGKYKHLDDKINSNRTIWHIAHADNKTGTFDIRVPLPDGTKSGPLGSDPVFEEGMHTLRALSGSLKPGDPQISLPLPGTLDNRFVVGEYKPTGIPDPVNAKESLKPNNKNGIVLTKQPGRWIVTVPNGKEGDFVYATYFDGDGIKYDLWPKNFGPLDKNKRFVLPISEVPSNPSTKAPQLAIQSANFKDWGSLVGWADASKSSPLPKPGPKPDPKPEPKPDPKPTKPGSSGSQGGGGIIAILISLLALGGIGGALFMAAKHFKLIP